MFFMILFLLFAGCRLTYWSIYHSLDISLTILLLLTGQRSYLQLIENQRAGCSDNPRIATCAEKPKTSQALKSIKVEQPVTQIPGKPSNVERSNDSQNATFVKGTDSTRALQSTIAKQPAAQKPRKPPNAERSNEALNVQSGKETENTCTFDSLFDLLKGPWYIEPSKEEAAHIALTMARMERRREARISIVKNGPRRGPCHYTKTTRTYKPSSTGDLITSEPLYPAKSEMAVIEKKNEPKNPADDKKAADITTPDHPSTKNEIQTMIFKPNHFTKATVSAQKLSLVADSITSQLLHSPKLEIVLKKKDVHKKSTNDETARIMTQMKPFIKGNIENMNMTWMTTLKDMKVPSHNGFIVPKETQEKPLPSSISSIKTIAGRQGLAKSIIITPSIRIVIENLLRPILHGNITPSVMRTALTILGGHSQYLMVKSRHLDIMLDVKALMHGSTARQMSPSPNLQVQWHCRPQVSDSRSCMVEGRPTPPMLALGNYMPMYNSLGLRCPKEIMPVVKPTKHGENEKSPNMPPVPVVKGLTTLPDFTSAFTFSLPIESQAEPTEPTPEQGVGNKHLGAIEEVQAKLATQVQKQKEAKARLANATSALRNSRKGNAGRNATKAKKAAAKAFQACTDRVQTLRVEEQEIRASMAV